MRTKTAVFISLGLALLFAALSLFVTLPQPGLSVRARPADESLVLQGADDPSHTRPQLLPGEKLDINSASMEELMLLPGVGKALAEDIILWRQENGAFDCAEDIMKIGGIGKSGFEALEEWIYAGELK